MSSANKVLAFLKKLNKLGILGYCLFLFLILVVWLVNVI